MANEKQVNILRQGVDVWNQWRYVNEGVTPDLSGVSLSNFDLIRADLSGAILIRTSLRNVDLYKTDLSGADLSEADLSGTDFRGANLIGANLSKAILPGVDFSEKKFKGAILSGADLSEANLSRADFAEADLREANLYQANLNRTKFNNAKLIKTNLDETILVQADLFEADLTGASLVGANLVNASLKGANLREANLSVARLLHADLDRADLSGSILWESQRAGWSIKSVICEYVYWDKEAKEKTFYQPGDFERLFTEQKRVKLFYKDGANLLEIATLPAIIRQLEEAHPGFRLSFKSIEEASGGAIATLVLESDKDIADEQIEAMRAEIQSEAEQQIRYLRHALEGSQKTVNLLTGKVEGLKEAIGEIVSQQKGEIVMGNKYEISGQAGAVGDNAQAKDMTLNQTQELKTDEDTQ